MFRRTRPSQVPRPPAAHVGPFAKLEAGRYQVPISYSILIPGEISEDDYQALIQKQLQKLRQDVQKAKDTIYSALLVALGGLGTLSFLVLGDLISLGSADLALRISLSAFAVALPLLAASYWNVKIWHGAVEPHPRIRSGLSQAEEEQLNAVHFYAESSGLARTGGEKFVALLTNVDFAGLLMIVPAALIALIGLASALWHVFWIASLAFLVAVIIGCILIGRTAFYRLMFRDRGFPPAIPRRSR